MAATIAYFISKMFVEMEYLELKILLNILSG
jgi:hypothetical protein